MATLSREAKIFPRNDKWQWGWAGKGISKIMLSMNKQWADGSKGKVQPGRWSRNDGEFYSEVLAGLREDPGCVGAHLCGAYLRNRVRYRGLLDEFEQPDEEMLALIERANHKTQAWAAKAGLE